MRNVFVISYIVVLFLAVSTIVKVIIKFVIEG